MDGGQIATPLALGFMGLALAVMAPVGPFAAPAAGAQSTPALDALDSAVSHAIHGGYLALALPQGGVMMFAPVYVASERATPAAG
jgi:hypothetical protein